MELTFKPIDLEKHSAICVKFRLDAFVCSFGPDRARWATPFDEAEYLDWLSKKIEKNPDRALHVWIGNEIIGQLELGTLREDPDAGYVNLYYLAPAFRGSGISRELDAYVESYFRRFGMTRLKLCVSPSNLRALAYYKKCGWKDAGPRPDRPEVHFMQKELG
jgi:RimJ/RimL family protein N-acetyltransferase